MTLIEPETSNVNVRTVQLVKLLTEVGPDIPEISRRLGQFKESVRYRYKEKILNKGFAVQASADHEKLGLKRVMMVLEFSDAYREYGQSILASMNELCFLVGFFKTLPNGYYVAEFSAPSESVEDLKGFFGEMKEKGMFSKVEVFDFDWIRISPMMPEFYDFDTGRWDFDWSTQPQKDFASARYQPAGRTKFDYVDLLIIKELQMDANKSLKEISDKLGVNYKKLAWHYGTHVLARRLVRSYSVNWMGTSYNYELDKALHRQHRYFGVQLLVREPSEFEVISIRQELDRLPFLWSEAVGRNYAAQLVFPVDSVVEGLQYLANTIRVAKEKCEYYIVDQTDAVRFTIPYRLYDTSAKKWQFNRAGLVSRFDQLILKIKNGPS